ncbi:MAG: methyltransferase [Actinobacteria bacterium RBG_16_67_10]|nr:MAG: methyltransferase [Actinobacteria bacterium RBG_16_67_10]
MRPMDRWQAVDDHLVELFDLDDDALRATVAATAAAGMPQIQVSATLGRFLNVQARAIGARRILEIGTLAGYSSIWLARALPRDGRLITLERDPRHAQVARANLARAGLDALVEVRVGPAAESLAALVADGVEPFDMVFIDADKEGYPDYLEWSLRLSRPGTLIVADNVVRGGAIIDAASPDSRVQGIRRFNAALARDPRLAATIVQTVGAKGYDGMAFAVVLDR